MAGPRESAISYHMRRGQPRSRQGQRPSSSAAAGNFPLLTAISPYEALRFFYVVATLIAAYQG